MRTTSIGWAGIASATAVILVITAVALLFSPPAGSTIRNGLRPSQVMSEYRSEIQDLADRKFYLPSGYTWPANFAVDAKGPDNQPMTYERGYGRVQADMSWFLSWAKTACATDTTQSRNASTSQLERVKHTLYYQSMRESDRDLYDAVIAEAKEGKLARLRQIVTSNSYIIGVMSGALSSDK